MTSIKKINLNGTEYTIGGDDVPFGVKSAMDNMFAHTLYKDYDSSNDYATFHAWANTLTVTSITAVFTQGTTKVFTCDSLDTLKQYLVVTATFSDESTSTVEFYTLSGNLTAGTSIITVSYQGATTTFTVNVIAGTDVTPALSSFIDGERMSHTIEGSSIRIYTTSNRATGNLYTPFTPKYGYTYLISADIAWVKGKARLGIENASTEQGILLVPTSATTESGSYSREAVLSDSDRWTTDASFKLWCTWSTSEAGDVTFSNLRVIEYLAGE